MRVIVAIDASRCSQRAVDVAIDLAARRPGVELTAVHIVNVVASSGSFLADLPGRIGFEPAVVSAEVSQQHDEAGRALLAKAKAKGAEAGVEVRTVLDHGAVAERLGHHASHADLIVLGQSGETEERFPGQGGSTVNKVLVDVPSTALLVREEGAPVRRVLLGYDGSTAAAHTVGLVNRLGAESVDELHAVWVNTGDVTTSPLADLPESLQAFHLVTRELDGPGVSEAVVSYAEAAKIDTIAIGFSGASPVRDFLFGRGYETLLRSHQFNLLIAH